MAHRTIKLVSLGAVLVFMAATAMNTVQIGLGQTGCFITSIKIDGPLEGIPGETVTFTGQTVVEGCSAKPAFAWKLSSAPSGVPPWTATGQQVEYKVLTVGGYVFHLDVEAGKGADRAFASRDLTFASGHKIVPSCPPAQPYTYCVFEGSVGHDLDFSPDGKTLASGNIFESTITLYDAFTGTVVHTLSGHSGNIRGLAFSPDDKLIASSATDNTIRLWDVATGTTIRTLTGHTDWVLPVAFSPDGKLLASGSRDKTIRLWDVATGTEVRILTNSIFTVTLDFTPDGKLLASGSCSQTQDRFCVQAEVQLWDVVTGAQVRTIHSRMAGVNSVAFSPDGKLLASGSCAIPADQPYCDHGEIKLWDVVTGAEVRSLSSNPGEKEVAASLSFSPNGKILASGTPFAGGKIELWDTATGRLLRVIGIYMQVYLSVIFSPDGEFLATNLFTTVPGNKLFYVGDLTGQ